MLKTTPQNYGGLLFVITNPKNLRKSPQRGHWRQPATRPARGRWQGWIAGEAAGERKKYTVRLLTHFVIFVWQPGSRFLMLTDVVVFFRNLRICWSMGLNFE